LSDFGNGKSPSPQAVLSENEKDIKFGTGAPAAFTTVPVHHRVR
jgi:hypothetical protein